MKSNKNILAILAAASLFSVQSCLKEQEDIFSQSSSERLQAYIEEARNILTSAENGWIMEYYPGSSQALGGYAYHLSFTETEVEAVCEIDPDNSYTSFYKMTTDNGAVLSFDAYNPALHYFATPSSTEYQAKGGDFEFTITSVSPEKIGLVGKRSGNHYDLYPYNEESTPQQYLKKVVEMSESMRASIIEGKIGETEVTGTLDFNNRRIVFTYTVPKASLPNSEPAAGTKAEDSDEPQESTDTTIVVEAPYMYTNVGLRTYEPVKVAGYTINNIFYNSDNNILTTGSVTFYGKLPDDYTNYADFAGDYTLTLNEGKTTYNVTLSPDETSTGYIMSGLNPNFVVSLGYDTAQGRLTMNSQIVGSNGNNSVWFCAWSLNDGGTLTWNTDYGMTISKDLETDNFIFTDNGKTDLVIDSFILWETTSSNTTVGQFMGWGQSQFPYLQTLTRK